MATVVQPILERTDVSFRRILVATDFSPASERALDFASAFAAQHRSRLYVVHALHPPVRQSVPLDPLPRELDRERLEAERKMSALENDPRIRVVPHISLMRTGDVWEVIQAVVQTERVDLIVVGTHGRGTIKKLALGSVAEEVLRKAECPVITIGPRVAATSEADCCRSILFPTDFGPASTRALPYALGLAREWRAKLVLLHMVPPVAAMQAGYVQAVFGAGELIEWQSTIREDAKKKLKEIVPPGTLDPEPEYLVDAEFLPDGILFSAAQHKVDFIVMGVNQSARPRVAAHLPWPVIHDVICESRCPVLTVSA
jgi:nucleotide-binding universal stress UspA family protein